MRSSRWWDAGRGIVAVLLGVAVAHLLAAITEPARSPLAVAGSLVVRSVPTWLEQLAVQQLGNADKPVLLVTLSIGVLVLSGLAGLLARRNRAQGAVAVAFIAGVAVVAAVLGSSASPSSALADALPSIVGAVVAVVAFLLLTRDDAVPAQSVSTDPPANDEPARSMATPTRRGVVLGVVGVAVAAAFVGAAGEAVRRARVAQAAIARAVRLPAPADPAPALPSDVEVGVDGVTPFRVPNGDFYRVDTALVVPQVDPTTWTLRVGGMVSSPFEITWDELLAMPMIERDLTLTCVSNEVGGPYCGNARWLGVRLTDVLDRAGIDPSAEQLLSTSADGFTASTPISVALDGRDSMIAVGMNGEPLPPEHGFPARMVVPGLYGFVSATKWVVSIEATTYAAQQAYWTQRGWATEAPVRTMARIDVPRPLGTIPPGKVAIAGVCWAQHRGIGGVEVQIDDGPWQAARLGGAPSDDTWRQWYFPWDATSGRHSLRVRAVDGTGATQPADRLDPFPSGAQGWHEVVITVG
ncbi:MAG: molybdopterin-dependent oxidoreductase [Actinobacteria bacterium]|nr:molybdopterin-dependent oxidoreductase [Actinomycetota bacterium]